MPPGDHVGAVAKQNANKEELPMLVRSPAPAAVSSDAPEWRSA